MKDLVLQYEDDATYVAWFLDAVGAPARFLRGAIYQHPVVQPLLDWDSDRGIAPINYEGRTRARKGKVANKPARGTPAPNWGLEMKDRRAAGGECYVKILHALLLSQQAWNAELHSSNPTGIARMVAAALTSGRDSVTLSVNNSVYFRVTFYRAFGRILWKAG
jgi:hypothetical protein